MDYPTIMIAVTGMALVTVLCRVLPFAVLGKVALNDKVAAWMRYLPVAILAGVVAPHLCFNSAERIWGAVNLPMLAALPTVAVGFLSRSLLASVLAGVGSGGFFRLF